MIEQNTVEHFFTLARANRDEIWDRPELKAVFGGRGHSRIFRARLPRESASEEVALVAARLAGLGERGSWYVTPSSAPRSLRRLLRAQGFEHRKDWISMAIDMERVPESPLPGGFLIEEAYTLAERTLWADVQARSFGVEGPFARAYQLYFLGPRLRRNYRFRPFLGMLNGIPVATAALFYGSDALGLYWVGTLPEARGRGVATAMTATLLRAARGQGYSHCVLNASAQGYRLYRKLGFKKYYTTNVFQRP